MKPGSPDRALEQSYTEAESALARIAHVNRLSRDINDIKYYSIDLVESGASGTIKILSKKGIVEILNAGGSSDLYISLKHPEITLEKDKFYIQLSVYSNGPAIPVIFSTGFVDPNTLNITIHDVDGGITWGDLYFYYDIVKIE